MSQFGRAATCCARRPEWLWNFLVRSPRITVLFECAGTKDKRPHAISAADGTSECGENFVVVLTARCCPERICSQSAQLKLLDHWRRGLIVRDNNGQAHRCGITHPQRSAADRHRHRKAIDVTHSAAVLVAFTGDRATGLYRR